MLDLLYYFVSGLLVVCGVQTVWFCSDLPVHLCKLFKLIREDDDVYTWEEWQIWAVTRSTFFGSLFSCTVCLSFWISLGTSCLQHFYLGIGSYAYVVTCALGWPALAYAFYKKTND